MIDYLRIRQEGFDDECIIFDKMRDKIEANLALFGIKDVLQNQGYDTEDKKLIVSRNIGYSSQKADIDRDLDPLAQPMYVDYELGIVTEQPSLNDPRQRMLSGKYLRVAQSLIGEELNPTDFGNNFKPGQLDIIQFSIESLNYARLAKILPSLNKNLTKLEL
jgi:hypothetical protein